MNKQLQHGGARTPPACPRFRGAWPSPPDPRRPGGMWLSRFAAWERLACSHTAAIAPVNTTSHSQRVSGAIIPPELLAPAGKLEEPWMETRSSWGAAPLHPPTRCPGNAQARCLPHGNGRPAPTWGLTGSSCALSPATLHLGPDSVLRVTEGKVYGVSELDLTPRENARVPVS